MEVEELGEEEAAVAQGGQAGDAGQEAGSQVGAAFDYEAAIAERDERIAALEAQVAQAARDAETAQALATQIEELKASAAAEREEFALTMAGCRSIKAARALLGDHGGDVAALKAAEPWLFLDGANTAGSTGVTGLPNAGAATDEGATLLRWRELAGLSD